MKNSLVKALAVFALTMSSVGFNSAQALTNADFLKLSEGQKDWWYLGAVESLGHLISMYDKEKAQRVWKWLPSDPEAKKDLLKRSFEMYPDENPTSILLALLQRSCGKLTPNH